MSKSRILAEIRRQIESHDLTAASIVVAVSGGPDSVALLHALHTLRDDLDIRLRAAHLDHGLRPGASAADAEFVRDLTDSLDIPLTVGCADVYRFRKRHRLSLEDAARRLRYRFLAGVACENGADAIALGHTLDDQAETVLMRLLRGTGLAGLRSMSTLSDIEIEGAEAALFRPLLSVSKAETISYCAANRLCARLDESNLSTDLTRNRIRIELMPLLETYNPSARLALSRLAQSAALDIDFIRQQVERVSDDVMETGALGVSLDRRRFSELHPAIQRHLLRLAFETASGDLSDLGMAHVADMLDIMSGAAGRGVDLPRGLRLEAEYERARIIGREDAGARDGPRPVSPSAPIPVAVPGETIIEGWKISVSAAPSVVSKPRMEVRAVGAQLSERFDADSLGEEMRVRPRAPGDRFQPLGVSSPKKLKDFMIDAHVPRRWRDGVPLIESGGRIAWVVGWRIADWAKVTPDTRRAVDVSFEPLAHR